MNRSDTERELVEIYSDAKRNNDTNMIIALYAIILRLLERQGAVPPDQISGFTKGEYKRAIKNLRQAQVRALRLGNPDMAAEYDLSVRYIRERCVNRVKEAA